MSPYPHCSIGLSCLLAEATDEVATVSVAMVASTQNDEALENVEHFQIEIKLLSHIALACVV